MNHTVSHRERFEKCMKHEPLDRVPMDIWLDSNNPTVKSKLVEYAGFASYEQLLDHLDIDIWRTKPSVAKQYKNTDNEDIKFFIPSTDPNFLTLSSKIKRPLIDAEEVEDLDKISWPSADIFDYDSLLPLCKGQEDRVIWVQPGSWSPIFCRMCDLAGMEKVMMDMLLNPALTEAVIERIFNFYYEVFKRTLEAGKGKIDVFSFGDDYATQLDLMFDAKYWRLYFKEPTRKLIALAKSYGALVAFHSCGAIDKIIPDLIEIGVDILFPIQPKAKGMDAQTIKSKYGNDIVFYGGIDVQEILPFGSEDDVRKEVSRVLGIMGKDGGYILCSGHSILEDVPQANVLAMYDEAMKFASK